MYAERASEAAAKARLSRARRERISRAQKQHTKDAQRLLRTVQEVYEKHDTKQCLESAEFALEQIYRKSSQLLLGKEKFLEDIYDIVANAFLDQVISY